MGDAVVIGALGGKIDGLTKRKTLIMDAIHDSNSLGLGDDMEVMWYDGYLYVRTASQVHKLDKDFNIIATSAGFSTLVGMYVDADGVFITSYGTQRVYKLSLTDLTTLLTSNTGNANWRFNSLTIATADHVYVFTEAGTGLYYVYLKSTMVQVASGSMTGITAGDEPLGGIWNPRLGKLWVGYATESNVFEFEPSVSLNTNIEVSGASVGIANYIACGFDDGVNMWTSGMSGTTISDGGFQSSMRKGDDLGAYTDLPHVGFYFNFITTHANSDYVALIGSIQKLVGDDGGTSWTKMYQKMIGLHEKSTGKTFEIGILPILAMFSSSEARRWMAMDDEGNVYVVGKFGYGAGGATSADGKPRLVKYKLVDAIPSMGMISSM